MLPTTQSYANRDFPARPRSLRQRKGIRGTEAVIIHSQLTLLTGRVIALQGLPLDAPGKCLFCSSWREQHLRRVLTLYSLYYNETRTHLGLSKDAPLRRAVQRSGTIVTIPIFFGLHHRYART
jgi:hypothetical protein